MGSRASGQHSRSRRPLPDGLRPMLARSGSLPDRDAGWAYEMKWDGLRALAYLEDGHTRLVSRSGRDITHSYPELSGLAAGLPAHHQLLLDGEAVVLGAGGWPDFGTLSQRMNAGSQAARQLAAVMPVTYLAFDLLQLDGEPLLGRPYRERRAALEQLGLDGPHWQTPPSFRGERGRDVLALSRRHGLEGVVAKRLESRYEPGRRSGSWCKIKNLHRQEAVVGGWLPGHGGRAGQIGSLLAGVHGPAGLEYAGRVGTGFSQRTLDMLTARLAGLRRPGPPFDGPVPPAHARGAVWVEPALVIEVAFAGWTRSGRMRAPSFQGLRPDKEPAEVVREDWPPTVPAGPGSGGRASAPPLSGWRSDGEDDRHPTQPQQGSDPRNGRDQGS